MVLLLDTDTLPPSERNNALTALISQASGPARVTHDVADELIRSKTHFWNVGDRNGFIRTQDAAVRYTRTAQEVRENEQELFAMTYQYSGSSVIVDGEDIVVQHAGMLTLNRVARAHEFAFPGKAEIGSFLLSKADLGLPASLVAGSGPKLAGSPLYGLVQAHFAGLSDTAEELASKQEASGLFASATIQLIRALVASTDTTDAHGREVVHDASREAAAAYVRQHLKEASLNAERIAYAIGTTERNIQSLWSGDDESFDEWITRARLRQVRDELSRRDGVGVLFEDVAREWGVSDMSLFTSRFLATYGGLSAAEF